MENSIATRGADRLGRTVTVSLGRSPWWADSLESYSTRVPFEEASRIPSLGSPSTHLWTRAVRVNESRPIGVGVKVPFTFPVRGWPGIEKAFQVTVDSFRVPSVDGSPPSARLW